MVQLVPFYRGSDRDVCRVFGNSFQFHGYLVQARQRLVSIPCDRFLFIADDLVLNPAVTEDTLPALMKLEGDACFYPGMNDVSEGECLRGTMEAHNFELYPPGLDASVLRRIPSYEEAFSRLHRKGLMRSRKLGKLRPFFPLFEQPSLANLRTNYKVFRARLWHLRNALKYRLKPQIASYPVVFGYSDIFSLPRMYLTEFLDYLEVFASVRMFVELAIPTTFALHDWPMVYESNLELKPLNVWFPQDPRLFREKQKVIDSMAVQAGYVVKNIPQAFPKEYLYLHPVKLSKWRSS